MNPFLSTNIIRLLLLPIEKVSVFGDSKKVFLGEKAKTLGLVDEVGDFDVALDIAAQLGKVRRQVTYVKPRPTFPERLFSRFAGNLAEEVLTEAEYLASPQIYYLSSTSNFDLR